MKRLKLLLCFLVCLLIAVTSLSGCFGGKISLNLASEEQNSEAREYDLLEKQEKIKLIEDKMQKAFDLGQKQVKFNFDCTDLLFEAYNTVYHENPQHFWLGISSSFKKSTLGEKVTVTFKPEIMLTDEEITSMQKEIDAETARVLSGADGKSTDYQKALYIHDYIVDNTVYDKQSAEVIINAQQDADLPKTARDSSGIYGCLVNRKAVCSGYAATFKYFADKLGLDCMRVSGEDRKTGTPHQWNCVKIEGEYYHLDTTWDDKISEDANKNNKDYEYFLINEQDLLLTHKIDSDATVPECNSEKYNYFVYNGLYMEKYNFKAFSSIVSANSANKEISVKFSSPQECSAAYSDLFENRQKFWGIPGVDTKQTTTSISESGKILNISF